MKQRAFTLAEVLITLLIVGIIAAITIPNLHASYQKQIVGNKVVHFYAMINNILKKSYIENGPPEDWGKTFKNYDYQDNKDFLYKYFEPYIKYKRIDECYTNENGIRLSCVFLPDDTMFYLTFNADGCDIYFYANGKVFKNTRNYFVFQLNKLADKNTTVIKSINFVEPFTETWDGNTSQLMTGNNFSCSKGKANPAFCTKLLQVNSWKIPDDYPW